MTAGGSERYWDERARENALFFVDNEVSYDDPDTERFWRRGEEIVDRMLDMAEVEVGPGEVVVDIGCGVGRLTRALARRAGRVYGLDVSREMLRLAQQHNTDLANVEWVHGDGMGLAGIENDSVDGCFSHVVFQHIPDPAITANYVREMGRVLRPGGWTVFQVSTDPSVHRKPAGGIRDRLKAFLRREDDRAWWGSAVDLDELRAAARDGGLELERVFDEGSQFTTVFGRRPDAR